MIKTKYSKQFKKIKEPKPQKDFKAHLNQIEIERLRAFNKLLTEILSEFQKERW